MPSLERKHGESDMAMAQPSSKKESYYPHHMYLDGVDVEKLDLGGSKVGDELIMSVTAKVSSMSVSANEGGKKRMSMTLTLTEAYPEGPKQKKKSLEQRIYPENKNGDDK